MVHTKGIKPHSGRATSNITLVYNCKFSGNAAFADWRRRLFVSIETKTGLLRMLKLTCKVFELMQNKGLELYLIRTK